jgi:hypothetical protein
MRRHLRVIFITLIFCVLVFERCAYNDINADFDCANSTLSISLDSKTDVSNCRAIDGVITVTASGGLQPYAYNIGGGEYQSNPTFHNLGGGSYEVRVKDSNNCWRAVNVTLATAGSTLAATVQTTADNQCSTDNGVALVTATGGTGPYVYQIDAKGYSEINSFPGLKEGQHVVVVKDSQGCETTLNVRIEHGQTGISYATQIKTIISANCAKSGCHDAGAGSRNWTDFTNLKAHAASVKIRTANRTMPPDNPLSQADIDLIGCWVADGALNN